MKKYHTSYKVDGGSFGLDIYAKDLDEAEYFADIRGLNESIYKNPSEFFDSNIREEKLASYLIYSGAPIMKILHALAHLGDLAIRSNTSTVDEILGDHGVLHDYLHYQEHQDLGINLDEIVTKIKEIEVSIPGYLPDYWSVDWYTAFSSGRLRLT